MSNNNEIIKTGVRGLDEILNGGFPKNYSVLVTGRSGSGKSILTEQILNNFSKKGINSLYITYEQEPEQLRIIGDMFGWEIREFEKDGKITLMEGNVYSISESINELNKIIKEKNIKAVAIDSITSLTVNIDKNELKQQLLALIKFFRKMKINSFFITEIPPDSEWLSRDTYSESIVDCIIKLNSVEGEEEGFRSINIPKMRLSKQKTGIYSFKITDKGVEILT